MDLFWVVTLFHFHRTKDTWVILENESYAKFNTIGIEEFALTEPEVDSILGERSYSGGDLPEEVLQEVEDVVFSVPGSYRFFFQIKEDAASFYEYVKKEFLCEAQLEEQEVQDWNAEWKKHYSPIRVNHFLEVIPSWDREHTSNSREQIYIYPGMGFGTGSHETTFLCLKLFTEHFLGKQIENALDFGSGSGILGLSVFKFFPEAEIDFYDIDPEANKNCYINAEINRLHKKSFRLILPEYRDQLKKRYDLVFANILEGILIEEKEYLISVMRPQGFIILSGLLRHQADGIIKMYKESGLSAIERLEKGDWAAILFQRD